MRHFERFAICLALALWSRSFIRTQPTNDGPTRALMTAIRAGDKKAVTQFLGQGASVNARDETGATALMQASLNSDVGMMKQLLRDGADVNAQDSSGATALVWAMHDPKKVKLLLDHDAKVTDEAVLACVAIPREEAVPKLFAARGVDFNINRNGFTPLMAAVRGGSLNTVRFLIDQGADVRAKTRSGYTALYGAASWPGNGAIIQFLLEKGADANARVEIHEPAHDVYTALIAAIIHGDTPALKALLDHGADCNQQGGDFGRTALLMAATTGNEETVKLLLDRGADVHAKDHLGHSPLWWARRRGDPRVVELLKNAGAREPSSAPPPKELPRLQAKPGQASADRALAKAIPLLQQSGVRFSERRDCVSCHHQSLVAMAVGLARQRSFGVDEQIAAKEQARGLTVLEKSREKLLLGSGATDELAPAYILAGLGAGGQQPNRVTDALVQYLVVRQYPDGSWKTPVYRPPQDASDFTITALAVRGLARYVPRGRAKEIEGRIGSAREWLLRTKPREAEEMAFRLLGLRWSGALPSQVDEAVATLLPRQREDGGWAQLSTLESDAYATGLALFALHEGGGIAASNQVYRRGVEYLLSTQLADGSWIVQTRSFPLQPFVGTAFPHGRSQFISLSATCWASMALALTREPDASWP